MSTSTAPDQQPWWKLWRRLFRRTPVFRSDASHESLQQDQDLVMGLSTRRIPGLKQLGVLPSVLQPSERRWVRVWTSLAILSALTLLGQVIFNHVSTKPQAGGTLTEAMIGVPQFINPVLARPNTVDAGLVDLTFRGLLRVDNNFQIVPDLAQSFERSTDGKVYTVTLRSGLLWSDGQPLTADDAVYTFTTMADSQFKSPWLGNVQGLKVVAQGKDKIVFTFSQASQSNLTTLTLGLIPSHLWSDQTGQTFSLAELNTKPVGNGPMKFSSLTKDRSGQIKSMTFVRNKSYNGTTTLLDRLVFKFYPDSTSAVQALTTGAADSLADVPSDAVAGITKHSHVTNIPIAQLVGVFFNQRTNPVIKASEVRRALAMSIDRKDILNHALQNRGQVDVSPLVPGMPGHNANLKLNGNQLDQATALLDSAGWKVGSDGVRAKGKQKLTFTITTVDEPSFHAVADALVARWQLLGAKVTVNAVDPTQIERGTIQTRQYDALLFGQRFSADGDPYPYWDSSQQHDPGFGLAIFFDKNVDKDVEDAHVTTNSDKLVKDLLDFQNLVNDNTPAIILYQSVSLYAHPSQLRGFNQSHLVTSSNRFDDISSWYLRTGLTWEQKKK